MPFLGLTLRRLGFLRPDFPRLSWLSLTLALFTPGCVSSKVERNLDPAANDNKHVLVVHNDWHTSIVARAADLAGGDIPELSGFPSVDFFEISWGDAEYFPDPDAGIGLALKAAFFSSGSVLHVVGFSSPVKSSYPGAEIIDVELSEEEFYRLINFISLEFQRDQPGKPALARPGLYPNSRFYAANSRFGLFNNCNTWVAEAFRSAGLPVKTRVYTAGGLAREIKRFGTIQ